MAKAQAPSNIRFQVNSAYKAASDGMSTHRKHDVGIKVDIRSQQKEGEVKGGPVRLVVDYSTTNDFDRSGRVVSGWGGTRKNVTVRLKNLTENTHYFTKIRVEQQNLDRLSNASEIDFYTERQPLPPRLDAPSDNTTVNEGGDIIFEWKHQDADTEPDDPQDKAEFRWRRAETLTQKAGDWRTVTLTGEDHKHTVETADMGGNQHYDWQVRTKDTHSTWWSQWSARSFYLKGATTPPRPVSPVNGAASSTDDGITFTWKFRDPDAGERQVQADLRYRVAGAFPNPEEGWTLLVGTNDQPGGAEEWVIPSGQILPGYKYEWQVRTYNAVGTGRSAWSRTEIFRAIRKPGWAVNQNDAIPVSVPQGALGEGEYRLHAFDQGGKRYRGEIKPISNLIWTRVRDDISTCTVRTNGFGEDCGRMMGELRTWAHELVLFRNGERVWEGPITRIGDETDTIEIEARDPMAYVYRAIMRQGYNDNYRRPKQGIQGTRSVVERAAIIIQNAMAPWDHSRNILPYLTVINYPNDARQSRTVLDWSKTAWGEVDDLAATAGLDYTCVGRRIILHDTHRPVGLLAEMRGSDFFSPPIITEYGMSAANVFGVTSSTGVYGKYEFPEEDWFGAGPIEQLASAYGEDAESAADPRTLTRAEKEHLAQVLDLQAARNINGRWAAVHIDKQGTDDIDDDTTVAGKVFGAPIVVRVPDNSRLHPETAVGIQQLVPGVHIPLRVQTRVRAVAQVQKLDLLHVVVEGGVESVQVTMSPAPVAGIDPDQGQGDVVE
jgi:hypothetical protein